MEYYKNYLAHHGILGQKWGIRRYQNEDGSLTEAGKERYYKSYSKAIKNIDKLSYLEREVKISENSEKLFSDSIKNNVIKKEQIEKLADTFKKASDIDHEIESKTYSKEWLTKVDKLTETQLEYEGYLDNLKKAAKEGGYHYKDTKTYYEAYSSNMYPDNILADDDPDYINNLKNEIKKNNQKAIKFYNEAKSIKESKIFKDLTDLQEEYINVSREERAIERDIVGSILGEKGKDLYDKNKIHTPYNINELIEKYSK